MTEIWKEIDGFDGRYQISNYGRVKTMWDSNQYQPRINRERFLVPSIHRQGYLRVGLTKDGKTHLYYIHRLVANAFLPNPYGLPQVNHKDEDKANNIVIPGHPELSNLEWCDSKYNSNYGTKKDRHREQVCKPIIQTDLDGHFIRRFRSATDAEKECGYDSAYISMVCTGRRKTAYGFVFRFEG